MSFVITTTTGSSVTLNGDNDITVTIVGEVVTLTITPKAVTEDVEAEVSALGRCRSSEYDVECECDGCTIIAAARQDFLRDERQEASRNRPWTCVRCESINDAQRTVCEVCDEVHSI